MEDFIQNIVVSQVYALMLIFTRVGTAMMIMPGIGDGFVPERVRLLFALAFSAVMTPIIAPQLPEFTTGSVQFLVLLVGEFIMGAFIGGIARIFMTALDTAGMFVSMQIGLANAQIFNPQFASQGSIMGAFLSITGALLLFATNLHHELITAIVQSYQTFPPGMLDSAFIGDLADTVAMAVTQAFAIGFHFAMPFIIVTTMIYIAMGILSRLMPQLQVFVLSMPIQIITGFLTFIMVASAGMMFWLTGYENGIRMFIAPLAGGGG
ncbi:MAG TPA: flagellar biosynthetic protein FliR [Alphaproteobacteria bacterium]